MGKRSRQQSRARAPRDGAREAESGERASGGAARARSRAARAVDQAERAIKQRPSAPWDPFPLMELAIFSGIVLFVAGAVIGGTTGKGLLAAGFVLVCIGGLDTALREHFGGYRSHAGLFAGILGLAVLVIATASTRTPIAARAALLVGVFAIAFPALRRDFIRRSGGRGVM